MELPEPLDPGVSQDQQEMRGRRETGVTKETKDLKVNQDIPERGALMVCQERTALQDSRADQERGDQRDPRDLQVCLVGQALLESWVDPDLKDLLEREEKGENKDQQDPRDPLDQTDLRAQLEKPEARETAENKETRENQDSKELLAFQDPRDPTETTDPLDPRDPAERMAKGENQDREEYQDPTAKTELPETLEHMGLRDPWEHQDD